jgi:hypothetical protein
MKKFKLTLSSSLIVEYYGNNMIEAIKHIENYYNTGVIKAEQVF